MLAARKLRVPLLRHQAPVLRQARLSLVVSSATSSEKQLSMPHPQDDVPPLPPVSTLLSDARITAAAGYNRWQQLFPACFAGTALGTYFAVPGVLGPHICRAQGVVAAAASDFSMGSVVPMAALMSLVAGVLAATLANYSAGFGVRRVALAGSVFFPAGIYFLPAVAVQANALTAYSLTTVAVGGFGFYCIYPQIPPLLSTRWFPDKPGLAVSIYFTGFGSGVIVASKVMQALLAHFRRAPERIGGLDEVPLTLGTHGERLAAVPLALGADADAASAGSAAEVVTRTVEVVLATQRDLVASGFKGLEEGVYVVGTGSNGVCETMVGMGCLTFTMLHVAGWSYRLPHATDAAEYQATAKAQLAVAKRKASDLRYETLAPAAQADATPATAAAAVPQLTADGRPMLDGYSLAEAHRTPHMYLLWASTGALGITGLPFLLSGQFMINDIFGGSALPSAVIGATAVAFPAMVGTANMVGRGVWGPVSDRLGRGTTYGLFGLLSVPSLLLLPTATGMVATAPESALLAFKAASLMTVGVFAGGPVLLAPATTDLFGPRDAQAIYGRLWMMLPAANFFGASLVSKVREFSYAKHALAIAGQCDEATFQATFGAGRAEAATLIASKTVTLPLLLPIAPEGTIDPSPLLYDDAFYTLAGFSTLAFLCNVAAFRIPIKARRAGQEI